MGRDRDGNQKTRVKEKRAVKKLKGKGGRKEKCKEMRTHDYEG